LNDLVGDMLLLARPRLPQKEVVDAAQLGRDVVVLAGQSGRGEDVIVRYEGVESLLVSADESQLRQVLWNLVRNAVQTSSAGDEVCVRIEKLPNGAASIAVSDKGPGIPPEARDKIFDAFYTTRSHGTGVGLAVVKRIIDAHGWTIEVTGSEGAKFEVIAPASAVIQPS
jgi:two-component system, NtrC family, sensor histidine kinase HydH